MQTYKVLVLTMIMLCSSSLLYADASGSWEMTFANLNQGNVFTIGDAVDESLLIVFGIEVVQGNNTPVLKVSTNGGYAFNSVTPESYGGMFTVFTDIQMINKNLGYAVGMEVSMGFTAGPFWKITNKGTKVEQVVMEMGAFPECSRLHCLGESKCWVSCKDSRVPYTANGGDDWNFTTLPETDFTDAGPIFFLNDTTGWLMMGSSEETEVEGKEVVKTILPNGTTFKTTNGGQNWVAVNSDQTYLYSDIQFVSSTVGYLTAYNDNSAYIMKTTNGGTDWTILPLMPKIGEQSLAIVDGMNFLDENTGWVAASYGEKDGNLGNKLVMYYTENGGSSWLPHDVTFTDENEQTQTMGGAIHDMAVVNEHLIFGFGEMQTVVRYQDDEYVPPVDGDEDTVNPTDGDQEAEIETGPVYNGEYGEPCPVPGDSATYEFPRCNEGAGTGLCLWNDKIEAHCTAFCDSDDDCHKLNPNSCCKPLDFENSVTNDGGKKVTVCMVYADNCVTYSGQWSGYSGAMLGEACKDKNDEHKNNPDCDPNYTGKLCIDEQNDGPTYCSKICTTDDDCFGGFEEDVCCNLESEGLMYCRYGHNCDPDWTWEPDGDDDSSNPDGDAVTDGDIVADGDSTGGSGETDGSGGCNQTHANGLLLLLMLMALVRLRKVR